MTLAGAVFLAALILGGACAALLLMVAMTGARRKITSGPTVVLARVLFLVLVACIVIALAALVFLGVSSWAA